MRRLPTNEAASLVEVGQRESPRDQHNPVHSPVVLAVLPIYERNISSKFKGCPAARMTIDTAGHTIRRRQPNALSGNTDRRTSLKLNGGLLCQNSRTRLVTSPSSASACKCAETRDCRCRGIQASSTGTVRTTAQSFSPGAVVSRVRVRLSRGAFPTISPDFKPCTFNHRDDY